MSATDFHEDDELLAAELAFGLIDGDIRRDAEARLDRDVSFAAAHARWQDYAAAMFSDASEAPQASIWSAIEARLPANDLAPVVSRSSLRWWQASTALASAVAIALAVVSIQRPSISPAPVVARPAAQAPLVAVLTGKQGVLSVSYDRTSGRLTLAPTGIEIGDHAPELWVIPADGKPRSLGVIAVARPGWRAAPSSAAAIAPGVTLAISVEPIGGSPTGQPTGPVILTGTVATT